MSYTIIYSILPRRFSTLPRRFPTLTRRFRTLPSTRGKPQYNSPANCPDVPALLTHHVHADPAPIRTSHVKKYRFLEELAMSPFRNSIEKKTPL